MNNLPTIRRCRGAALLRPISASLLALLFFLGASNAHAQSLRIAAASDLQFALADLAAQYEKQSGQKLAITYGSSGNFFAQIQNGAPFDLFFSADIAYPQKLIDAGFAEYRFASTRTRSAASFCGFLPESPSDTPGSSNGTRCWTRAFRKLPSPIPITRPTDAPPLPPFKRPASTSDSNPNWFTAKIFRRPRNSCNLAAPRLAFWQCRLHLLPP